MLAPDFHKHDQPLGKILVTGAGGQIGSALVPFLIDRFGRSRVVTTVFPPSSSDNLKGISTEVLDVTDKAALSRMVTENEVDTIYHLAGVLSAKGEAEPDLAWKVNMQGLMNVLDVGKAFRIARIFWPSSIAVYGPDSPKNNASQGVPLNPTTMYGLTKVAGELLCNYYFLKYGLDVRSVRFPGIISSETLPGGGTTDFAVEIFYAALQGKTYSCFVREDTRLPMMYMPDALRAAVQITEADPSEVPRHLGYNLGALSFSAGEIAAEIKKSVPSFNVVYSPDWRQRIADSWPQSIDDSEARQDWRWSPEYSLGRMTEDMLVKLRRGFRAQ
jgi:nucleoside-diphosphate-sugar epimerase